VPLRPQLSGSSPAADTALTSLLRIFQQEGGTARGSPGRARHRSRRAAARPRGASPGHDRSYAGAAPLTPQSARCRYFRLPIVVVPQAGGSELLLNSFPVRLSALRLTQEPGPKRGSVPFRLLPCSCLCAGAAAAASLVAVTSCARDSANSYVCLDKHKCVAARYAQSQKAWEGRRAVPVLRRDGAAECVIRQVPAKHAPHQPRLTSVRSTRLRRA